jgi:hypothetical protein
MQLLWSWQHAAGVQGDQRRVLARAAVEELEGDAVASITGSAFTLVAYQLYWTV